MTETEYIRRNVVIEDDHQAFLNETEINFSAFVRQALDQYIEHHRHNEFAVDPTRIDVDGDAEERASKQATERDEIPGVE